MMGTGKSSNAAPRTIAAHLAAACPDVARAGSADVVCGTQARYVAAPASTAEAAALLRAAAELGLTIVPRGTASKLGRGSQPTSCDLIIDTRHLDQVLEHAAGDLVVSVQAGVTLDALADVLATAGQRLALDPPGGGTVGGVLATQSAGPLRFRYGAPRDLLIGITVVRADGTIARSGGKVVKNVAGYDLGKLFAGSYGTLGLITEATFRLHPLPTAAAVISLESSDPQSAAAAVHAAADSPLAPSAIELDWPAASAPIGVSVLLEGDEVSVGERAERMVALLGARGTAGQSPAYPKRADDRLSHPAHTAGETTIQIAFWPGRLEAVLGIIKSAASDEALDPVVSGSAAAGVLHVNVAAQAPASAVASFVAALRSGLARLANGSVLPSVASAVVLHAPPEVRDAVDLWGPVPSLALMRAVKDQFDPEHRMAPGRFAGGI
jgi:glycolate oxidase FAD binding subunit